jgi:RNA polymerase sigma-70 factor (ECF subfamily)
LDREAFDRVVSRYGLQLLRTARLIVRDEGLAEDVVQETFLKAWRSFDTLRGQEDPTGWLNRIAVNESISAWRRRHRFDALLERFGRQPAEATDAGTELKLDLKRALDRLTADQRAVIVLRYYQDLSVEETAQALGIPIDTAKSRLKAGLRRLRELTQAVGDAL